MSKKKPKKSEKPVIRILHSKRSGNIKIMDSSHKVEDVKYG